MTDDFRDWARATASEPVQERTQSTFDRRKCYAYALGEMVQGRSPSIDQVAVASGSVHGARLAMGRGRNGKGGVQLDREKVRKKNGEAGPGLIYPPSPRNKALLYLALTATGETDESLAQSLGLDGVEALHAAIRKPLPPSELDVMIDKIMSMTNEELLALVPDAGLPS